MLLCSVADKIQYLSGEMPGAQQFGTIHMFLAESVPEWWLPVAVPYCRHIHALCDSPQDPLSLISPSTTRISANVFYLLALYYLGMLDLPKARWGSSFAFINSLGEIEISTFGWLAIFVICIIFSKYIIPKF